LWCWETIYHDGTTLFQYDQTGIYHQIREIDQSKLATFVMENIDSHQQIAMIFPKGSILFHQYENLITSEGERYRAFIFGYDKHFVVVTFNNDIIVTDDYKKVDLRTGNLIK
jgi:hypothetical protein